MTYPLSDFVPLHEPIHNVLFTIPRTASHLLTQLLNLASQTSIRRSSNNKDGYLFLPALAHRFRKNLLERPVSEWSEDDATSLREALQSGFDDWITLIESAARERKSTYIKEHVNWMLDPVIENKMLGHVDSNEKRAFAVSWNDNTSAKEHDPENVTCLPTRFLLNSVKPTFLLRHPALAFPSALRTSIDIEGLSAALASERTQRWECTFTWSLSLYHLYTQDLAFNRATLIEGIEYPIVLDASDLKNEALVKTYAKAVGLDADRVRFQWEVVGEEEREGLGRAEKRMKSTIIESKGIEKEKLGNAEIDIESSREAWRVEFGDVLADRLFSLVLASMPAYEELRRSRLRVDSQMRYERGGDREIGTRRN